MWCFLIIRFIFQVAVFPHLVVRVDGISIDVSTNPRELGFRIHSDDRPDSNDLYMIQPKLWGSLLAQIGPYTSEHLFKMPSVSVHLNTHVIQMYGTYTTPLYALCNIENPQLVLQPNIMIVCGFYVTIPSISPTIFRNSSCTIQFNEFECAAYIDLSFLRLQLSLSSLTRLTVHVSQNVTAFQVNQSATYIRYAEMPEVTGSLILLSRTLPPVTVFLLGDYMWHNFLQDNYRESGVLAGIPHFRSRNTFPVILGINKKSTIMEFTFKLLLGSNLRFYYQEPARTREWLVQAVSRPFGALVRARRLAEHRLVDGGTDSNLLVIGELVLEEIPSGGEHREFRTTSWPNEELSGVDDFMDSGINEPGLTKSSMPIQLQLLSMTPSNLTRAEEHVRTLRLQIPPRVPAADSMHIFVQFEPRDILEPPWFPAIPTPEPYKLRVLSLTPTPMGSSLTDPLVSIFGPPTAGRLTDITDHVFCRPATHRVHPEEASSTSAGSACPTAMPRAPPEVDEALSHAEDENIPAFRNALHDHLVLALPGGSSSTTGAGTSPAIVPTIYGTVQSAKGETTWAWREMCGPTVRRWMLEGFRIHVDKTELRQIHGWKIAASSVYDGRFDPSGPNMFNSSSGIVDRFEQTTITVTARIYMMRPGTGQRVYLGSSDVPFEPFSGPSHAQQSSEPMQFDVTSLLPNWALVVRPVLTRKDEVTEVAAAYVHRDAFTERPYLVGRWPGRVVLGLVATSGDSQPLATVYVDVGARNRAGERSKPLTVASIRAECIDPLLRLSGQLTPAYLSTGEEDTEIYGLRRPESSAGASMKWKSLGDFTLPSPQRLNVQLQRITYSSTGNGLITAAASSASRDLQYMHSLYHKAKGRTHSSPVPKPPVPSSSASCPVHLLAVSLILSDGSTIPTHNIPSGQLRISSFESKVVWDPAIPITFDSPKRLGKRDQLFDQAKHRTERVRINSLVVWCPRLKNSQGFPVQDIAPLGAMDEVIAAVESGHALKDPGPPWSSSQLILKSTTPHPGRSDAGVHKYRNRSTILTDSSSSGHADVFFSSQSRFDRNSRQSNSDHEARRPSTLVTYILIGIGCLAVFLLSVNGIVLLALRKRRQSPSGLKKGNCKPECEACDPLYPKANGTYPHSNCSPACSNRQHLLNSNIAHPPDVVPMAGGLSVSSMGSGNAGHAGNLKQSMLIEASMNPYLMTSESSTAGFIHSPQSSQFTHVPPFPAMDPTCWAAANVQPRQFPLMNAHSQYGSDGWAARMSPTIQGPFNAGYTSALGSVGTAEGCSDEGVASNFEMISLSQEIPHSTHLPQQRLVNGIPAVGGGGASSTTSGGSGSGGAGVGAAFPNSNRGIFKRSPTSGIGVGSLSGGSSTAELNECRSMKRPEFNVYPDRLSPDRPSLQQIHANSPPGRQPVKTPLLMSFGENFRERRSPSANAMTESFTRDTARKNNMPEMQQNSPSSRRQPSRSRTNSIGGTKNDHTWNLPLPTLTCSNTNGLNRSINMLSEDMDNSPVPLPPNLLLTNRMCLDSLTPQCRAALSPMLHRDASPCDGRTSYKRSDSFGMATKPHGPIEVNGSSALQNHQLFEHAPAMNKMVGDTMDLSDEVSSESRSSSAWRRNNQSPTKPLTVNSISSSSGFQQVNHVNESFPSQI